MTQAEYYLVDYEGIFFRVTKVLNDPYISKAHHDLIGLSTILHL